MTAEAGEAAPDAPARQDTAAPVLGSATAIVFAAVCACWLTDASPAPTLAERLPLLRAALALGLLAAGTAAVTALWRRAASRLRRRWWDPADGRPEGPLSWDQIHALVAFDPDSDPLVPVGANRAGRATREWLPAALAATVVVLVAAQALAFLWDPTPWPGFLSGGDDDRLFRDVVGASGNLTAYLALLASAITIVFTYGQLQARVRADSRQQWIIQARSLLADALAAAEAHRSAAPWSRARARQEMDRRRLELELMLNPSEKDHRLLLYLVQRNALLGLVGEDDIQDARSVRHSIARSGSAPAQAGAVPFEHPDGAARPDLGPAWNSVLYASRREDLLAYVLRLAHVVFKREWERVKHTR